MEIKKVTEQNGEYRCNIDITVTEWKEILQDKTIISENCLDVLLKFYAEPEYKATCKALGKKYSKSAQAFNGTIIAFAKASQKKLNRFQVERENGKACYWVIPMTGKELPNGFFEWTLRDELVTAIKDEIMDKQYIKFKKLLEYFVAHLEYMQNGEVPNSIGYENYIQPLLEKNKFLKTGRGYDGDRIQNAIKDWKQYPNGEVCVNISVNYGSYKTRRSYLTWSTGNCDVVAKWKGEHIDGLFQARYKSNQPLGNIVEIETLGLFDNKQTVTEELKQFYDDFNQHLLDYQSQQKNEQKMQQIQPYINLLKANKNLILTGVPATGKTYLAKQMAKEINADFELVQFHPSYDYTDFVEGLRPVKKDGDELGFELKDGVFKTFCKRALKNFVDSSKTEEELSKEELAHNNICDFLDNAIEEDQKFELKNGNEFTITEYTENHILVNASSNEKTPIVKLPLCELSQLLQNSVELQKVKDIKKFFNRKWNTQFDSYIFTLYNSNLLNKDLKNNITITPIEQKNFVFIIDEINRAEISKVFGELFYSIDAGYRGEQGKVKTQYANLQDDSDVFANGFYIPENVYIIGTMNDIDRSVESMDFAMRRRFAWQEITAEDSLSILENLDDIELKNKAKNRLLNLNQQISTIQELGSAYHIGGAYFLKLDNYDNDFDKLWDYHLKGVLFEYLRGLPNADTYLAELKEAYNNESKPNINPNNETVDATND